MDSSRRERNPGITTSGCSSLLDLALPGIGGLEALPMIRAVAPEAKVVVLSGLEPGDYADVARRRGAYAYCTKGGDPTSLPGSLGDLPVAGSAKSSTLP